MDSKSIKGSEYNLNSRCQNTSRSQLLFDAVSEKSIENSLLNYVNKNIDKITETEHAEAKVMAQMTHGVDLVISPSRSEAKLEKLSQCNISVKSRELIFDESASRFKFKDQQFLCKKRSNDKDCIQIIDEETRNQCIDREYKLKANAKLKAKLSDAKKCIDTLKAKTKRLEKMILFGKVQPLSITKFSISQESKPSFVSPVVPLVIFVFPPTNTEAYSLSITRDMLNPHGDYGMVIDSVAKFDKEIEEGGVVCNLFPESCKFLFSPQGLMYKHSCVIGHKYTTLKIKCCKINDELFSNFSRYPGNERSKAQTSQRSTTNMLYYLEDTRSILGALSFIETEYLGVHFLNIKEIVVGINHNIKIFQGIVYALSIINPNICFQSQTPKFKEFVSEIGYNSFTSKKLSKLSKDDQWLLAPTFSSTDRMLWL
jgi:hypothetical protein